jgi:phosphocarrier protein HPr
MIKETVAIINKLGLHARASAKLVSTALRFQSQLTLIKDGQTVNGKSIMAVMTLGAKQGSQLGLELDGPDEDEMRIALVNLIQGKFGELE